MDEYRVNLEAYNGPLDLLLYLIKREEVAIYDIPIARITEQYLAYVELLKQLDPNVVGDFLVLAATLMEIKARMLLPIPPPEEGEEEGLGDPRADLIRQLLEYKAFKDAAGELRDAADVQAQKLPRGPAERRTDADKGIELGEVQIWDLFDAFSKIMEAIGHRATDQEVIYDDTPIELHAADIVDRLRREPDMTFRQVFEGRTVRSEIVGLFMALLELIRRGKVLFRQEANFGHIHVTLNPDPPPDEDSQAE